MTDPEQDIFRVLLAFMGEFPHGFMGDKEIAAAINLSSPETVHHLELMKSQG